MPTNSARKHESLSSYHDKYPSLDLLKCYLHGHENEAFPKPANAAFYGFFSNASDLRVLDLGCGLGSIICQGLLECGLLQANFFSLDADRENFRQDAYERKNKVAGSAEAIPLEGNYFDLVHSTMMTPDNPSINFNVVLKEISRVLKSGGFYLAFEDFDRVKMLIQNDPEQYSSCQDLTGIVYDNDFLDLIGFGPAEKVCYCKTEDHSSDFYLFRKKK